MVHAHSGLLSRASIALSFGSSRRCSCRFRIWVGRRYDLWSSCRCGRWFRICFKHRSGLWSSRRSGRWCRIWSGHHPELWTRHRGTSWFQIHSKCCSELWRHRSEPPKLIIYYRDTGTNITPLHGYFCFALVSLTAAARFANFAAAFFSWNSASSVGRSSSPLSQALHFPLRMPLHTLASCLQKG